MPRPYRKKSKIGIYHIVVTGIGGVDIFINDDDKTEYLKILDYKSTHMNFFIYAYCFMPNHVHILTNESSFNISSIMKCINTAYTYYYNARYKRVGSLFHDRFRSEPINDEDTLAAVISFIHTNPISDSFVREIDKYPWSSLKSYLEWDDGYETIIDIKNLFKLFPNVAANCKFSPSNHHMCNQTFIEYYNSFSNKAIPSEGDAEVHIREFLYHNGIKLEEIMTNKELRNKLIHQLKKESSLSVRAIAKLLNINRGVVQRVKH